MKWWAFRTMYSNLRACCEFFFGRAGRKMGIGMFGGVAIFFALAVVVKAGNLSPSSSPAATFYTLEDIYTRLTVNTEATEGDHVFSPGSSPASSLYTLTQIYNAIPTILANTVKLGTSYLGVSGTLTPDGGTATVADFFDGKTAHVTNDWSLDTGTLTLACNIATFNGIANLVPGAYDGAGDGTNRFCMTDSGDAVAGDLVAGKTAWVDGQAIAGSMTDRDGDNASSAQAAAGGVNYFTAPTGFYDGDDRVSATDAQVVALDGDLVAGNVVSGNTIFGVAGSASPGYTYGDENQSFVLGTATGAGTALADLFNGTRTDGGFAGGSQAAGGVDDYNNGDAPEADRYAGPWTACNSGNNYCGTGLSTADARDDSTGLIWSLACNGTGCSSFSDSTPITYTWDNSGGSNNSQTAYQLCSAGSHGQSGWSLPHQKQLLQAYIDGSMGNLEAAGIHRSYWAATTQSVTTTSAWSVYLSMGYMSDLGKNSGRYVRCVR